MTSDMAEALLQAVPFARTLGIALVSIRPASVGSASTGSASTGPASAGPGGDSGDPRDVEAVAELPDQTAVHNHVGGPHAGALFTLGETASGAVVLAAFGDQLDRAVPLTVRAEIAYRRFATGTVRAVARLDTPPARVVTELDLGDRPEFAVRVDLYTGDGEVHVAEMSVVWTLKPR